MLESHPVTIGVVVSTGDIKISAFKAGHSPVHPAVGYRIDYKDRSVLVTGDTVITDDVIRNADQADLILTDALSLIIIDVLAETADRFGMNRKAKVLRDVRDYHASTTSLIKMAESTGSMVGFYHMVPPQANIVMEKIYERDLPDNVLLTNDGMWFTLPVGGDDIDVTQP